LRNRFTKKTGLERTEGGGGTAAKMQLWLNLGREKEEHWGTFERGSAVVGTEVGGLGGSNGTTLPLGRGGGNYSVARARKAQFNKKTLK